MRLADLKEQCSNIAIRKGAHILLVSAPYPAATLSTALLGRAILKSGGLFQIKHLEPIVHIEKINELRKRYSKSEIIVVDITIFGKKRLRKGQNYPLFIGGTSKLDQVQSQTVGFGESSSVVSYALAAQKMIAGDYELMLSVLGTLIREKSAAKPSKATKDVIKIAKEQDLLQEHKDFRLFGTNLMPVNEVFLNSTRPYLPGVSGDPKVCEKILRDSGIRYTKLSATLDSLSTEEKQRLNSQLLPRLPPSIIPHVLGHDYILSQEESNSPLRLLSGVKAISEISWSIGELGILTGVLIGDRARVQRALLDSHIKHQKDVLNGVQEISRKSSDIIPEIESIPNLLTMPLTGISSSSLSDAGRVAFEAGFVNNNRLLVLTSQDICSVVWNSDAIVLADVFSLFSQYNINPISTSNNSVRINMPIQKIQEGLVQLANQLT